VTDLIECRNGTSDTSADTQVTSTIRILLALLSSAYLLNIVDKNTRASKEFLGWLDLKNQDGYLISAGIRSAGWQMPLLLLFEPNVQIEIVEKTPQQHQM
jgi:hypothetical protein